jgi:hypothetical protein
LNLPLVLFGLLLCALLFGLCKGYRFVLIFYLYQLDLSAATPCRCSGLIAVRELLGCLSRLCLRFPPNDFLPILLCAPGFSFVFLQPLVKPLLLSGFGSQTLYPLGTLVLPGFLFALNSQRRQITPPLAPCQSLFLVPCWLHFLRPILLRAGEHWSYLSVGGSSFCFQL